MAKVRAIFRVEHEDGTELVGPHQVDVDFDAVDALTPGEKAEHEMAVAVDPEQARRAHRGMISGKRHKAAHEIGTAVAGAIVALMEKRKADESAPGFVPLEKAVVPERPADVEGSGEESLHAEHG